MRTSRLTLRFVALAYLAVLLLVPVGLVFWRTFEHGLAPVWESITTPAAIHAFWLTIEVAAIAVPLNAIFGVLAALALVRGRFRGKAVLDALIDLPFAVSPVVVGLSLILVYGRGGWLADLPFQVIFAVPGIVLATVFVSLPFVAREVAPVLREIGDEQEQAAATLGASRWQTFRRITLPAIRPGILAGAFIAFMASVDNVSVSLFLAGPENDVLPIRMWSMLESQLDVRTAAVSGVLIFTTAILVVVMDRIVGLTRRIS